MAARRTARQGAPKRLRQGGSGSARIKRAGSPGAPKRLRQAGSGQAGSGRKPPDKAPHLQQALAPQTAHANRGKPGKAPQTAHANRGKPGKAPYLQQALAHHASRRRVEQWLRAGRIQVNGRTARPGQRLQDSDRVSLDGRPLRARPVGQPRVLALYKPEGRICTRRDPEGRPTVYEILPQEELRWLSIGRLDINSSGLLLFSNDGALVQHLTHPGARIEREYAVRVFGRITERKRMNMLNGVFLDGQQARFHSISPLGGEGANRWYRVVLLRGIQREVRRIWASQGLQVNRLIRTRYGNCRLPANRKSGDCWELSSRDLQGLLSLAAAGRRRRVR